jgi:hypothetical protein
MPHRHKVSLFPTSGKFTHTSAACPTSHKSIHTLEAYTSDFESCADILTCDRTPKQVTIELIIPYTKADIFREKGAKIKKKSLRATEF